MIYNQLEFPIGGEDLKGVLDLFRTEFIMHLVLRKLNRKIGIGEFGSANIDYKYNLIYNLKKQGCFTCTINSLLGRWFVTEPIKPSNPEAQPEVKDIYKSLLL